MRPSSRPCTVAHKPVAVGGDLLASVPNGYAKNDGNGIVCATEMGAGFPTSSKSLTFAPRPCFGQVGSKCFVKANHFFAELQEKDLNHYDIMCGMTIMWPLIAVIHCLKSDQGDVCMRPSSRPCTVAHKPVAAGGDLLASVANGYTENGVNGIVCAMEMGAGFPTSSKSLTFAPRPCFGQVGSKCIVKANHFFAELQEKDLNHYDIRCGMTIMWPLITAIHCLKSDQRDVCMRPSSSPCTVAHKPVAAGGDLLASVANGYTENGGNRIICAMEMRAGFPTSSKSLTFAPRPCFGKIGSKCIVKANHFFTELQEKDLNHYDIMCGMTIMWPLIASIHCLKSDQGDVCMRPSSRPCTVAHKPVAAGGDLLASVANGYTENGRNGIVCAMEMGAGFPTSSKSLTFAPRSCFGQVGSKCIVKANHFFAELQEKDLNHYDVTITPEVASRAVNKAIMAELVRLYRETDLGMRLPAYDGRKSLCTAGELPFVFKEFTVKFIDEDDCINGPKRVREYRVVIRFVARANMHHLGEFLAGKRVDAPQEALQILDIVFTELLSKWYQFSLCL